MSRIHYVTAAATLAIAGALFTTHGFAQQPAAPALIRDVTNLLAVPPPNDWEAARRWTSGRENHDSVVFRRLTFFKVTVRRVHRAVVQELHEMNELDVRLDVRAAGSDIIGSERLCRHHFAKLLAEPLLNGNSQ